MDVKWNKINKRDSEKVVLLPKKGILIAIVLEIISLRHEIFDTNHNMLAQ